MVRNLDSQALPLGHLGYIEEQIMLKHVTFPIKKKKKHVTLLHVLQNVSITAPWRTMYFKLYPSLLSGGHRAALLLPSGLAYLFIYFLRCRIIRTFI